MNNLFKKAFLVVVFVASNLPVNLLLGSTAGSISVVDKDLSSLFRQFTNFDDFKKVMEDNSIVAYRPIDIIDSDPALIDPANLFHYYPKFIKSADNKLYYDTRYTFPPSQQITFSLKSLTPVEAGGGGDCFFHSVRHELAKNNFIKSDGTSYSQEELRKKLSNIYCAIARNLQNTMLQDLSSELSQLSEHDHLQTSSSANNYGPYDLNDLSEWVKVVELYNPAKNAIKHKEMSSFKPNGQTKTRAELNLEYAQLFAGTSYYSQNKAIPNAFWPSNASLNVMMLANDLDVGYAYFIKLNNKYILLGYKEVKNKPTIFICHDGFGHFTAIKPAGEKTGEINLTMDDIKDTIEQSFDHSIAGNDDLQKQFAIDLHKIIKKSPELEEKFLKNTSTQEGLDEFIASLKDSNDIKTSAAVAKSADVSTVNVVQNASFSNVDFPSSVAAGQQQEPRKMRLWAQLVGVGQDFTETNIAYNSYARAVVGGIDLKINKNLLMGLFIGASGSEITKKSNKDDKNNTKNITGGIYGGFEISKNASFRGVLGLSKAFANSKASSLDSSKNTSNSFFDARFQYNLQLTSQVQLTPIIGYRLYRNGEFNYANLFTQNKLNNGTSHSALLGVNLNSVFKLGEISVSPKLRILGDVEFYNSVGVIEKTIGEDRLPTFAEDVIKTTNTITIGGSVLAYTEKFKVGVGFDWIVGKEYRGRVVKLNVGFDF
ncbi:MAG: autotransporter outer membrane beta-barrel domain-containing protein [Rickettsiaceae bacterium]|nr:autotransporter outer membrane beta-barrel domain-containing protein [Rickettsiaceae bacterium]